MTAWWTSTTRVRKVRARSSAALRAEVRGVALVSAGATELEIDVMRAPGRVVISDVAAGRRIQQGQLWRDETVACRAGRRSQDRSPRPWNQCHRAKLHQRFL